MFTNKVLTINWPSAKKLGAVFFTILSIFITGCKQVSVNDTNMGEIEALSVSVTPLTPISSTNSEDNTTDLSAHTPSPITVPTFTSTPHPSSTTPPTPVPSATPIPIIQGNLAILTTDRRHPQFSINGDLRIINLTTQESILLYEDVSSVNWSPDGRRLVFSAMNRNTLIEELFLVNSDGTDVLKLDPPVVGEANRLSPAWSPDGTKIAFSQPEAGEYLIHILDVEENNVQFLTKGVWPAWSPDGSRMAFIRLFPEGAHGDIFIIDIDGNNLQQVTENIEAGRPAWSPDGQFIAFYGFNRQNQESGLFVLNLESMQPLLVAPREYEMWMPIEKPIWLPDSLQILFAQDGELFVIHMNDLVPIPLNLPSNYYYLLGMLRPS